MDNETWAAIIIVGILAWFVYPTVVAPTPTPIDELKLSSAHHELMLDAYSSSSDELAWCAYGSISGATATITELKPASNVVISDGDIESARCSTRDLLGTFHTHPSGFCDPSRIDYVYYGRTQSSFFGVVCGDELTIVSEGHIFGGVKLTIS